MSALEEILGSLPIDQIAQEVGATPEEVQQASAATIPALLGGMQANAEGGGAGSLLEALGQHDTSLLDGGVDLGQVDRADGEQIASHIFGSKQDQVVNQLGSVSGGGMGSSLIKKMLPILAPIVLSYIAKQVMGGAGRSGGSSSSGGGLGDILGGILGGGGSSASDSGATQPSPSLPTQTSGADASTGSAGPGSLEDMLKNVLGSATGTQTQSTPSAPTQSASGGTGNIINDVLGGLLGGGRR